MKRLEEYTGIEVSTVCGGMQLRENTTGGLWCIASINDMANSEESLFNIKGKIKVDFRRGNELIDTGLWLANQNSLGIPTFPLSMNQDDKQALEKKLDEYYNPLPILPRFNRIE